MSTCVLNSKFWTESARPSRLGSVQTRSKARALVSVNKREDFSPAGSLLRGLLHTPSTLCYSWSRTLKIISDDQGVPSIRAEPVRTARADYTCVHTNERSHLHTATLKTRSRSSPTSGQKYLKRPFSHYWVTFYRKRQICAPVAYVCVFSYFILAESAVVS